MRNAIKTLGLIVAIGALATACAQSGYGGGYGNGYSNSNSAGQYSRDYRSGNGYQGSHNYGRRLPNGLVESDRIRLDPWLNNTSEGNRFVRDHYDVSRRDTINEDNAENANVFFRRWADVNRDYRLTDEEIRNALMHSANNYGFPHNDDGRHNYDGQTHGGGNAGYPDRGPDRAACDARSVQYLIGQTFSQQLVDEARVESGAQSLRWIPEGGAVTMDYRPDRLNIEYAQNGRVIDIKCG